MRRVRSGVDCVSDPAFEKLDALSIHVSKVQTHTHSESGIGDHRVSDERFVAVSDFQFEVGADRERIDGIDVTSAAPEIADASDETGIVLEVDGFKRGADGVTWMGSAFLHGHGSGTGGGGAQVFWSEGHGVNESDQSAMRRKWNNEKV